MKKHSLILALGCASASIFMVSCQQTGNPAGAAGVAGYPFDENGNYIDGAADGSAGWSPSTAATTAATAIDQATTPAPTYEPTPPADTGYTAVDSTPAYTPPAAPAYTPPAPEPSRPASVRSSSYTVRAGDSLWGISRAQGVSVAAIQSANNLSGTNIRVGQTLSIPGGSGGGGGAVAASSSGGTHTVSAGETLWGISRKHGVSVSALQSANGLAGDTVRIGQKLRIP